MIQYAKKWLTVLVCYRLADKLGGGNLADFGESFVICQTKTIHLSVHQSFTHVKHTV